MFVQHAQNVGEEYVCAVEETKNVKLMMMIVLARVYFVFSGIVKIVGRYFVVRI